jgi:hypothetical protein
MDKEDHMKRSKILVIVVLISVLLLSCSLLNIGSKFSPPTWIQGTWSDALDVTAYTFTSDNVTQTIGGYSIDLGLAYIAATVTETSNDTLYSFTIDQSGSVATYSFAKTSDTTVDYTVTASGTTAPAVELTKE